MSVPLCLCCVYWCITFCDTLNSMINALTWWCHCADVKRHSEERLALSGVHCVRGLRSAAWRGASDSVWRVWRQLPHLLPWSAPRQGPQGHLEMQMVCFAATIPLKCIRAFSPVFYWNKTCVTTLWVEFVTFSHCKTFESALVFAGAWNTTLVARRRLASAVIGRTTTHSAACAPASSSVRCATSTTMRMTQ